MTSLSSDPFAKYRVNKQDIKENDPFSKYRVNQENEVDPNKELDSYGSMEKAPATQFGKAAIRGFGNAAANVLERSAFQQEQASLPALLGFKPDVSTERNIAGKIRENVPNESDELLPSLVTSAVETAADPAQLLASVAPLVGAIKFGSWATKPLVNLAKKVPIIGKQLGALGELLGVGVAGASYQGAEDLIQGKLPSPQEMLDHGATWTVIDLALKSAGLFGRFVSALTNKAKATNKPSFTVLNDTIQEAKEKGIDISKPDQLATKALSILEGEAQATENLTKTASESKSLQNVKRMEKDLSIAEGEKASESLNKVGKHEPIDKKFGETVQKDIASSFKEAEAKYVPLYKNVEKVAENIKYSDKATINLVQNMVKDINTLRTKAANYDKVTNTLKTIAEDLGYSIESNADGAIKLLDSAGKEVTPATKVVYKNIPLSKGMELGRRLNQIVDYDIPEKSIRDKLKPAVRSVKAGNRQALKSFSPTAEQMFDRAEKMYGATAQKFGRDSIADIRHLQPTEKIVNIINNPTSLDDLRKVLTKSQYGDIERKIIEQYADKSAKDILKARTQLEPYMSKEGNKAFKELYSTKKLETLKDQLKPVLNKDGTIKFDSFKELIKDKEFLKQVEEIGGKEAVEFIRNLPVYQSEIEKNLARLATIKENAPVRGQGKLRNQKIANQPKRSVIQKAEDWIDDIGINKEANKVIKVALGISSTVHAGATLGYKVLMNLIKNKDKQTLYKRIVSKLQPEAKVDNDVIKSLFFALADGLTDAAEETENNKKQNGSANNIK